MKTITFINLITFITSMMTTISISKELKDNLRNLGRVGETYEDVIQRMYELTKKQILINFLYDRSDSVPIEEAISQAKKKWQK